MNQSPFRLLIALLLFGLVSACASQPATHYYTLSVPLDGVSSSREAKAPAPTLGIGPVSLPPILDHPGVVSETDSAQIKVSTYHLWAGDLTDLISHLVAERLSDLSGNAGIQPFPWDNRHRPQYSVSLDLEQFSGTLQGPVQLKLRWVLYTDQGRRELARDRILVRGDSPGGYAGYVNTLNDLVLDAVDKLHLTLQPWLKAS